MYGDSFKNCCVAIIVPEAPQLAAWATENGTTAQQVLADQNLEFKKVIMAEIQSLGVLRKLNSLEKPKEIHLASEPFSVENDILTPTFKLKRNIARKVFAEKIDEMYAALDARGI